jgi:hypothetical protein
LLVIFFSENYVPFPLLPKSEDLEKDATSGGWKPEKKEEGTTTRERIAALMSDWGAAGDGHRSATNDGVTRQHHQIQSPSCNTSGVSSQTSSELLDLPPSESSADSLSSESVDFKLIIGQSPLGPTQK